MHHRDLTGRTTEAQRRDSQPYQQRLAKGDMVPILTATRTRHRQLLRLLREQPGQQTADDPRFRA